MRVVIVAVVNGISNVLIDGVITNNQHRARRQGFELHADADGEGPDRADGSIEVERVPVSRDCRQRRGSRLILLKYAIFGVMPLVIPSVLLFVPLPIDQIPSQQGTDLEYIRYLAEQAGYVFYIDPGPDSRRQQGVLGTANQGGPGATGAERRHGRLHQRREPAVLLRPGEEQDSSGLYLQLANRSQLSPFRFRRSRR